MTDRSSWIQAFWTNTDAIHDAPAAKYAEWVFKISQALFSSCITCVRQEAIGLQQTRGTNKAIGVPPERGTRRGAAGA